MKICAYVDYMGTMGCTPDQEYEDIKRFLVILLDVKSKDLVFKKEIRSHDLENESCDIYVIDFGGVGLGCDGLIHSTFNELIRQIEEKPDVLFLIWSTFTVSRCYRDALEEQYSRDFEFPNVVLCHVDKNWAEKIKLWFKK